MGQCSPLGFRLLQETCCEIEGLSHLGAGCPHGGVKLLGVSIKGEDWALFSLCGTNQNFLFGEIGDPSTQWPRPIITTQLVNHQGEGKEENLQR